MKMFLLLVSLLTLAACEGGAGSGSAAEKYLDGVAGDSSEEVVLTATTETDIWVHGNKLEVLSTDDNVARMNVNGNEYECSLETRAGMVFTYTITGDKLTLQMDGEKEVYTRKIGAGNQLDGAWSLYEKDETGATLTTMTFNQTKMKIDLKCSFNE